MPPAYAGDCHAKAFRCLCGILLCFIFKVYLFSTGMQLDFTSFPVLPTERLVLRALEDRDDEALFAHRNDERVNTYLEAFRHRSITDTRAFIKRVQGDIHAGKSILWVLSRHGDHRFMGTVCLWNVRPEQRIAETGYTLDPLWQGQGYMREALAKAIDFGFGVMGLQTIGAYTHEHNAGSIRLLESLQFKQQPVPQKEVSANLVYFTLSVEPTG